MNKPVMIEREKNLVVNLNRKQYKIIEASLVHG